jgi:hypothetical protein
MKQLLAACLVSTLGLLGSNAWAATAGQDTVERLKLSTEVITALMATPDNGIPEEVLDSAKCIIVVPHLIEGGLSLAPNMVAESPPAAHLAVGAVQRSFQSAEEAGDCKSESREWIWSR